MSNMNQSLSMQGLKSAASAPMPDTSSDTSSAPNFGGTQKAGSTISQDPSVPADYQGPENGPFECDNCSFFVAPKNCSQPAVLTEVGDADGDGLADVDPKGCCNKFDTLKGQ